MEKSAEVTKIDELLQHTHQQIRDLTQGNTEYLAHFRELNPANRALLDLMQLRTLEAAASYPAAVLASLLEVAIALNVYAFECWRARGEMTVPVTLLSVPGQVQ